MRTGTEPSGRVRPCCLRPCYQYGAGFSLGPEAPEEIWVACLAAVPGSTATRCAAGGVASACDSRWLLRCSPLSFQKNVAALIRCIWTSHVQCHKVTFRLFPESYHSSPETQVEQIWPGPLSRVRGCVSRRVVWVTPGWPWPCGERAGVPWQTVSAEARTRGGRRALSGPDRPRRAYSPWTPEQTEAE